MGNSNRKTLSDKNFFLFLIVCGYSLMFLGSGMKDLWLIEVFLWDSDSLTFSFSFMVDGMSTIFLGTVLVISGSVSIYCKWYMLEEYYYFRFMSLVWLFVISMVFMVFIPNLVVLLLGWDGLGLTSFLLVAFYQNNKSLSAAMLTALTNRVGDALVLLGISLLLSEGGWLVYNYRPTVSLGVLGVVVVLAGMTKSAQMPFCAWLPAAMAAPTPVSSLVHSSTLVTAGVYLVLRSFYIVDKSSMGMSILMMCSLFTLILAGVSAIFSFDLKKVIALSTLSQLSLMMFAISIGLPGMAFFHLVTHAIFKALLFLGAGGVIHTNQGIQDLRMVSKGWQNLPVSMGVMVVASVSLSGAPFLSGFYSKDLIVEMSMSNGGLYWGCYMIEMLGLMFTSFYSMRMVLTSSFKKGLHDSKVLRVNESLMMKMPFLVLYTGAILLGIVLSDKMEKVNCYLVVLSISEKLSVLGVIVLGLVLWLTVLGNLSFKIWPSVGKRNFYLSMMYLENLTSHPNKKAFFDSSKVLYKVLDQGWLEYVGPQGVYRCLGLLGYYNEKGQVRYFTYYVMFWGFIVFLLMGLVLLV